MKNERIFPSNLSDRHQTQQKGNLEKKIVIQKQKFAQEMQNDRQSQATQIPMSQSMISSLDSPLQLKLIKMLGLNKYFMDNFIFKRKPSKYLIRSVNNRNTLILDSHYKPPNGYTMSTCIVEHEQHSIPICHFKPENSSNKKRGIIIFAHGNASDMSDSISYIQKICEKVESEFVVFDYSGYGESRETEVGEEIICGDLEIVLAWVTGGKRLDEVILWGFSLGTFPVLACAAKYPVRAVILQCPIASISCLFHSPLSSDLKFKEDHFSNLELISKVKCNILIAHSSADQIIPFNHALLLMEKFVKEHGKSKINFLEVSKINHNALHKYISAPKPNRLQIEVFRFIKNNIREIDEPSDKAEKVSLSQSRQKPSTPTHSSIQTPIFRPRKLSIYSESQKKIHKKTQYINHQLQNIKKNATEAFITEEEEEPFEIVFENGKIRKQLLRRKQDGLYGCFCFSN